MFEILISVLSLWLTVKAIGLVFKLTWGMAKAIASVLLAIAVPVLFLSLLFAGGILLLVPLTMICIAFGLLKAAV